uniref:C4-dicarboxylate ABC transporter substrate-binding protein n=1 Tax=Yoonia rhodophyticola TaxID=3137370 RepID=A0AAN0NIR0_9RHOB
MKIKSFAIAAISAITLALPAQAETLSLAYFMGANHPMNKAFLTPMGEMIAEETGGALTVEHYPGVL